MKKEMTWPCVSHNQSLQTLKVLFFMSSRTKPSPPPAVCEQLRQHRFALVPPTQSRSDFVRQLIGGGHVDDTPFTTEGRLPATNQSAELGEPEVSGASDPRIERPSSSSPHHRHHQTSTPPERQGGGEDNLLGTPFLVPLRTIQQLFESQFRRRHRRAVVGGAVPLSVSRRRLPSAGSFVSEPPTRPSTVSAPAARWLPVPASSSDTVAAHEEARAASSMTHHPVTSSIFVCGVEALRNHIGSAVNWPATRVPPRYWVVETLPALLGPSAEAAAVHALIPDLIEWDPDEGGQRDLGEQLVPSGPQPPPRARHPASTSASSRRPATHARGAPRVEPTAVVVSHQRVFPLPPPTPHPGPDEPRPTKVSQSRPTTGGGRPASSNSFASHTSTAAGRNAGHQDFRTSSLRLAAALDRFVMDTVGSRGLTILHSSDCLFPTAGADDEKGCIPSRRSAADRGDPGPLVTPSSAMAAEYSIMARKLLHVCDVGQAEIARTLAPHCFDQAALLDRLRCTFVDMALNAFDYVDDAKARWESRTSREAAMQSEIDELNTALKKERLRAGELQSRVTLLEGEVELRAMHLEHATARKEAAVVLQLAERQKERCAALKIESERMSVEAGGHILLAEGQGGPQTASEMEAATSTESGGALTDVTVSEHLYRPTVDLLGAIHALVGKTDAVMDKIYIDNGGVQLRNPSLAGQVAASRWSAVARSIGRMSLEADRQNHSGGRAGPSDNAQQEALDEAVLSALRVTRQGRTGGLLEAGFSGDAACDATSTLRLVAVVGVLREAAMTLREIETRVGAIQDHPLLAGGPSSPPHPIPSSSTATNDGSVVASFGSGAAQHSAMAGGHHRLLPPCDPHVPCPLCGRVQQLSVDEAQRRDELASQDVLKFATYELRDALEVKDRQVASLEGALSAATAKMEVLEDKLQRLSSRYGGGDSDDDSTSEPGTAGGARAAARSSLLPDDQAPAFSLLRKRAASNSAAPAALQISSPAVPPADTAFIVSNGSLGAASSVGATGVAGGLSGGPLVISLNINCSCCAGGTRDPSGIPRGARRPSVVVAADTGNDGALGSRRNSGTAVSSAGNADGAHPNGGRRRSSVARSDHAPSLRSLAHRTDEEDRKRLEDEELRLDAAALEDPDYRFLCNLIDTAPLVPPEVAKAAQERSLPSWLKQVSDLFLSKLTVDLIALKDLTARTNHLMGPATPSLLELKRVLPTFPRHLLGRFRVRYGTASLMEDNVSTLILTTQRFAALSDPRAQWFWRILSQPTKVIPLHLMLRFDRALDEIPLMSSPNATSRPLLASSSSAGRSPSPVVGPPTVLSWKAHDDELEPQRVALATLVTAAKLVVPRFVRLQAGGMSPAARSVLSSQRSPDGSHAELGDSASPGSAASLLNSLVESFHAGSAMLSDEEWNAITAPGVTGGTGGPRPGSSSKPTSARSTVDQLQRRYILRVQALRLVYDIVDRVGLV